MKIYVDELPKACFLCPCCEYWDKPNQYICQVLNNKCRKCEIVDHTKRNKNCPLKTLTDYTKQVRKEVVQEIGEQLGLRFDGKWQVCSDGSMTGDKTIMAVLDQIQGETK